MWDTLCVGNNKASSASDTLHNCASRKVKWDLWATCWVSDCGSTEMCRCTWEVNIKLVLKKLAVSAWAGLIWLRIGTSGRLL